MTEPSSSKSFGSHLENGLGGGTPTCKPAVPFLGNRCDKCHPGSAWAVSGGGGRADRCELREGGIHLTRIWVRKTIASPLCFIHGKVSKNMEVGHLTHRIKYLCSAPVAL